jgi:hypothetical protein
MVVREGEDGAWLTQACLFIYYNFSCPLCHINERYAMKVEEGRSGGINLFLNNRGVRNQVFIEIIPAHAKPGRLIRIGKIHERFSLYFFR